MRRCPRRGGPGHEPPRALAQRVAQGRGERGLDRPAVLLAGDQALRRQLEGLEPEHPKPLAVGDDPFVVPVRQELGAVDECLPGERLRVAIVEELAAEGEQLDDVDADQREQGDAVLVHVYDREAAPLDPPQGGPRLRAAWTSETSGHRAPASFIRWTGWVDRPRKATTRSTLWAAPARGRG